MPNTTLSIATLVGSRICHDLISPVGAIGNGLELIAMGGPVDSPELALISDSVASAAARIRFFRLAFGFASGAQAMGRPELAAIATGAFSGERHTVAWQAREDMPRRDVQAVFLAVLCLETALPLGGTIAVAHDANRYRVSGSGARIDCDPQLWRALADSQLPDNLRPSHVQFALLAIALRDLGRDLAIDIADESVTVSF